jgi:hypothetical protein
MSALWLVTVLAVTTSVSFAEEDTIFDFFEPEKGEKGAGPDKESQEKSTDEEHSGGGQVSEEGSPRQVESESDQKDHPEQSTGLLKDAPEAKRVITTHQREMQQRRSAYLKQLQAINQKYKAEMQRRQNRLLKHLHQLKKQRDTQDAADSPENIDKIINKLKNSSPEPLLPDPLLHNGKKHGSKEHNKEWIDILKHVEPSKDGLKGTWWRNEDEGTVINKREDIYRSGPLLRLPVKIEGGYTILIRFTRRKGDNAVMVSLPIKNRKVLLKLDTQAADGKWVHQIKNKRKPGDLTTGKTYELRVQVAIDKKTVTIASKLNDKRLLRGKWLIENLSHSRENGSRRAPNAGVPAISVVDCSVELHRIAAHSPSGSVEPLR